MKATLFNAAERPGNNLPALARGAAPRVRTGRRPGRTPVRFIALLGGYATRSTVDTSRRQHIPHLAETVEQCCEPLLANEVIELVIVVVPNEMRVHK